MLPCPTENGKLLLIASFRTLLWTTNYVTLTVTLRDRNAKGMAELFWKKKKNKKVWKCRRKGSWRGASQENGWLCECSCSECSSSFSSRRREKKFGSYTIKVVYRSFFKDSCQICLFFKNLGISVLPFVITRIIEFLKTDFRTHESRHCCSVNKTRKRKARIFL